MFEYVSFIGSVISYNRKEFCFIAMLVFGKSKIHLQGRNKEAK